MQFSFQNDGFSFLLPTPCTGVQVMFKLLVSTSDSNGKPPGFYLSCLARVSSENSRLERESPGVSCLLFLCQLSYHHLPSISMFLLTLRILSPGLNHHPSVFSSIKWG